MFEVGKNVARTNHILATLQLLVSESAFAALPKDQQAVVQEAASDAWGEQRDAAKRQNEQAEKELERLGVSFTSPDLVPFRNAVKSFWDQWGKAAGVQQQIASIMAQ